MSAWVVGAIVLTLVGATLLLVGAILVTLVGASFLTLAGATVLRRVGARVLARVGTTLALTGAVLLASGSPADAQTSLVAAVPREAIPAILDAFEAHAVVAMPDAHENEQIQTFTLALVRDSRFPAMVNDIVVEFGNARYQNVVDRFAGCEGLRRMAIAAPKPEIEKLKALCPAK